MHFLSWRVSLSLSESGPPPFSTRDSSSWSLVCAGPPLRFAFDSRAVVLTKRGPSRPCDAACSRLCLLPSDEEARLRKLPPRAPLRHLLRRSRHQGGAAPSPPCLSVALDVRQACAVGLFQAFFCRVFSSATSNRSCYVVRKLALPYKRVHTESSSPRRSCLSA